MTHSYNNKQIHPQHAEIPDNLGYFARPVDPRTGQRGDGWGGDNGGASHFSRPVERATGLSSFQQDLYGKTGRRAESPEEFKKIIGGLLGAPDLEKAMNEQGFKGNAKRYLRFLKDSQLRSDPDIYDNLMRQESELAPGFVQNTQPSPVSKIAAILKRRLS
jgi:hypothetical protein